MTTQSHVTSRRARRDAIAAQHAIPRDEAERDAPVDERWLLVQMDRDGRGYLSTHSAPEVAAQYAARTIDQNGAAGVLPSVLCDLDSEDVLDARLRVEWIH